MSKDTPVSGPWSLSSLPSSQQKNVLFGSAAAVRVLLAAAFPALPDLVTGCVEISTPVTSFKRSWQAKNEIKVAEADVRLVQEGLFLYNHGLSPYDGGVFHQAPLLLPLFSLLPDPESFPLATTLLYTALDLVAAQALVNIAASAQAHTSRLYTSPRAALAWSPIAIAATYLFNPFTLLTCLGRPTSVFSNVFTLLAVSKACDGSAITSVFALALAGYISLHPLLLFPPLVILAYDAMHLRHQQRALNRSSESPKEQTSAPPASLLSFAVRQTTTLAASFAVLLSLSFLITGSLEFIPSTYGTILSLRDLTPNVGLWWYFFIEIFDSFRSFFLAVFWLHMGAYTPALTIRLRNQPLAALVLLVGVAVVFMPYAEAGGAGMWLALVAVYGHLGELARYPFPALSALLYTSFLGPAFYYLWIYAGSGNANFFYAITLVWALALSVILGDLLYAILRDEWEKERPAVKGRSDVARV